MESVLIDSCISNDCPAVKSGPRLRVFKYARHGVMILALFCCGCQTTASSVPVTKVACGAFQPITWSGKDTPRTVSQIKEHNASGKAICGWGMK